MRLISTKNMLISAKSVKNSFNRLQHVIFFTMRDYFHDGNGEDYRISCSLKFNSHIERLFCSRIVSKTDFFFYFFNICVYYCCVLLNVGWSFFVCECLNNLHMYTWRIILKLASKNFLIISANDNALYFFS